MQVSFAKAVVNVESIRTDVTEYREDFDVLGMGNIDTTIELIPTINDSEELHEYEVSPKDMIRMLGGMARLEIVKAEQEGFGDCVAWIEILDIEKTRTFREARYYSELILLAKESGWIYNEDDDALYYAYTE